MLTTQPDLTYVPCVNPPRVITKTGAEGAAKPTAQIIKYIHKYNIIPVSSMQPHTFAFLRDVLVQAYQFCRLALPGTYTARQPLHDECKGCMCNGGIF